MDARSASKDDSAPEATGEKDVEAAIVAPPQEDAVMLPLPPVTASPSKVVASAEGTAAASAEGCAKPEKGADGAAAPKAIKVELDAHGGMRGLMAVHIAVFHFLGNNIAFTGDLMGETSVSPFIMLTGFTAAVV